VVESGDPAVPLPTTIRGIIAARLDALPPAERAVLLNASVAGRVFWAGALRRMSDDHEALAAALEELERRELISRQAVSAFEGQQQYTFRHVLVRDVAYELLPRAARRERHQEAALFFEAVGSAESGEVGAALARHWRDAGNSEKAIDYLVSAAEGAEHGWAKERAALLYREALTLVPETDGSRRRDLTLRIAVAETATYHVADARLLQSD
jgi:predicted ATPase